LHIPLFIVIQTRCSFVRNGSAYQVSESMAENYIACVSCNSAFVLSPKKWPVIIVLEVVGLSEQYTGSHVTGDGGEIGPVVAVEDSFGTGSSNGCHK
jgi:hypothetical protein